MKRLRDLRVWIAILTVVAVAVGPGALCGVAFGGWKFGLHTDDQVAIINTVIAAASWLLVAVAGVVALLAYLAASGRPDLSIEITFNFSFPNQPVFLAREDPDSEGWLQIRSYKQTRATVTLHNASVYAAKNPGVRIEFEGLYGMAEPPSGWNAVLFVTTVGIQALQWDGGTDSIVHGQWSRALPALDLDGMRLAQAGKDGALVVTLAADGMPPVRSRMPVRVLDSQAYDAYTADRATRMSN
ncbi:hypothetical protein [Streptomyces sp. RPT161]|uniref:hypothetical protein n=1 Tax=Streptomyces sp. RPT161 TaxID=3015993 RepID=UPI0022B8DD68|nr:hypothetical protein [Streptomyces sp. RPT161]